MNLRGHTLKEKELILKWDNWIEPRTQQYKVTSMEPCASGRLLVYAQGWAGSGAFGPSRPTRQELIAYISKAPAN